MEILPRSTSIATILNRFAEQIKQRLCNYSAQDLKHGLLRVTTAATPPTSSPRWRTCCAARNGGYRPTPTILTRMSAFMEAPAARMRMETPTSRRIQKARTALVLDHPFFGSLLFRLKDCECRSIQTMATDGVSLYYNPDFVETLDAATLAGTLAHEVMHRRCIIMCGARGAIQSNGIWHAISPLTPCSLRGTHPPVESFSTIALRNVWRNRSTTSLIGGLTDSGSEEEEGESGANKSNAERSPAGEANELSLPLPRGESAKSSMRLCPTRNLRPFQEQIREWNIAVNQATTIAKHAGKVPARPQRTLEGAAEAAVDWRELLRRYWSDTVPSGL